MERLRSGAAVRAFSQAARARGPVALVPTMGYLHEGHLALMRAAAAHAPTVVASVFVNPLQFGPNEDLARYPRDEAGDLDKCASAGCAAVFLPSVDEMYPPGAVTTVQCPPLADRLCGLTRPTHFTGVCTVVLKLFNLTACDVAVFGEKDYQQLAIIRRMATDLNVPVRVVGHPTVREPDGLAMSSRNAYLSPDERAQAVCLSRGLAAARGAWSEGERGVDALLAAARQPLESAPLAAPEYIELVDAGDLTPLSGEVATPALLAMAARFGRTRLIDNTVLG